jgi:hypothetical protein
MNFNYKQAQMGIPLQMPQNTQNNNSELGDKDAINIVDGIINTTNSESLKTFIPKVQQYIEKQHQFNTAGVDDKWEQLLNALQFNSESNKQSINPITNQKYPSPREIAVEIKKMFNEQLNKQSSAYNYKISEKKQNTNAPKYEQNKDKHKRGNPFKVLMGMAGKLLNHGVEKSDAVRYIKKKFDGFDNETIERAIDIVKDYNKKKQTKKTKKSFNYNEFVKEAQNTHAKTIYDVKPEWDKRSTAELASRHNWLKSLLYFIIMTHKELLNIYFKFKIL